MAEQSTLAIGAAISKNPAMMTHERAIFAARTAHSTQPVFLHELLADVNDLPFLHLWASSLPDLGHVIFHNDLLRLDFQSAKGKILSGPITPTMKASRCATFFTRLEAIIEASTPPGMATVTASHR